MSTGPNVTFSQGGASTNATKLTVTTLTMHNNKSRDGSITLDGVAIASTSGNTYLDAYRSLRLVNGANLHIAAEFHQKASNDVYVAGESLLSIGNKNYFGGGTLTISNATLSTGQIEYIGSTRPGGRIIFQGDHPLWNHGANANSFYSSIANANVQLDFLVPVGGYRTPPLQTKSPAKYRLGNNANSNGSCPLTVNVLDESPANLVSQTTETTLISWPNDGTTGGINPGMVLEGNLPLSRHQKVSDDEFVWSDDYDDFPSTLGVVIRGVSPLSERATKILLQ